jgi:hypothetical protein
MVEIRGNKHEKTESVLFVFESSPRDWQKNNQKHNVANSLHNSSQISVKKDFPDFPGL